MTQKLKHSGLTLTELIVVITIMAILMGIAAPVIKGMMQSFDSSTGTCQLINAALAGARAIAVREQTYAGVRFQQDADGRTYMIFIVHDPAPSPDGTGLANGFRAVSGRKPMKLPEHVGLVSNAANNNTALWGIPNWTNANTFSVVFSSAGTLTVHPVRIRNRNGYRDGDTAFSKDTIFNIESLVGSPNGAMFYQDDYPNPSVTNRGLTEEPSVNGFIFYDKRDIPYNHDMLWSSYFSTRKIEYISPYSGQVVMEYREQNP